MRTFDLASRLATTAALVLVAGVSGLTAAHAASDCSRSVTLANWGENPTGDIDVKAGETCSFPIEIRGTVTSSAIAQKPEHGKLKKVNASTYEFTPKAKYKGSDTFAIKATGQGPIATGTSVITVRATIK